MNFWSNGIRSNGVRSNGVSVKKNSVKLFFGKVIQNPKTSSNEDSYQEKTMIFVTNIIRCHLGCLRPFEIFTLTKTNGMFGIFGQNFAV
jgi:hypothetical protein